MVIKQKTTFSGLLLKLLFKSVFAWQDERELGDGITAVRFSSSDGSLLEGGLLPSKKDSIHGTIILCHPFLKYGWRYFINNHLAQDFAEQGFEVLCFNFKGFGASACSGALFSNDLEGAVDFVRTRQAGQRVFVLGCSFGGFQLVQAFLRGFGSQVDAAVLDSVPPYIHRFFRKGFMGWTMRLLSQSPLRDVLGMTPLSEAWPKISHGRVLMLIGEQDRLFSPKDILGFQAVPFLNLSHYPDAAHLELFKRHRRRYVDEVSQFFIESSPVSKSSKT